MFDQEFLRGELVRRIRACGGDPDLLGTGDRPDLAALHQALAGSAESGPVTVAVLESFDPGTLARSAAGFALGVPADPARAWYRAFTRTVFLTGSPTNLARRFSFDHVSDDGSLAWLGPREAGELLCLRRLLTLVVGAHEPDLPAELAVRIPGSAPAQGPAPGTRVLYVATAGLTVASYLVHVNHIVTEGVLAGLIRPASRLVLRHVPRLTRMPADLVRVHLDPADPGRLRGYACLTAETTG